MSFQAASKDLSRDKQFTSMTLIGGYDCDPNNPRKGVDLRVKGGELIEKSLCVLGNINVAGVIISNICGTVFTPKIQEKELTSGIQVCGNLLLNEDSYLIGNILAPSSGSIKTAIIEEAVPGQGVCVIGNLLATKLKEKEPDQGIEVCGNLLVTKLKEKEPNQGVDVCGNLNLVGTSRVIGNISIPCSGSIKTSSIEECSPGNGIYINGAVKSNGDLVICNNGDLYLKPTGFVIIANSASELDLSKQVIANVLAVEAAAGCPLGLQADTGFKVKITGGDGIDMMGTDLCNVGNISSSGSGPISIINNIDMNCGNVSNVEVIRCNLYLGKNSPFYVGDLMNFVNGTIGSISINMNDRQIDNAYAIQSTRYNQALFNSNLNGNVGDVLTINGSGEWAASASSGASGNAGGVLSGSYPNPSLAPSGVGAGTYGSSSLIPVISVNSGGQITSVVNTGLSLMGTNIIGVNSAPNIKEYSFFMPDTTLEYEIARFSGLPDGNHVFQIMVTWDRNGGAQGGGFWWDGFVRTIGGINQAVPGPNINLLRTYGNPYSGADCIVTAGDTLRLTLKIGLPGSAYVNSRLVSMVTSSGAIY